LHGLTPKCPSLSPSEVHEIESCILTAFIAFREPTTRCEARVLRQHEPVVHFFSPLTLFPAENLQLPASRYAPRESLEACITIALDVVLFHLHMMVLSHSHVEFKPVRLGHVRAIDCMHEVLQRFSPSLRARIEVRLDEDYLPAQLKRLGQLGREVFQEIDAPVTPSFELDQTPLPSFVPAFDEFYPKELENTGKTSAVSLEFIIDPDGYVLNPRIISISTAGFEEAALRAVAHMRYQPVRVDGQPAYVSTTMPIQFSAKKGSRARRGNRNPVSWSKTQFHVVAFVRTPS